MTGLEPKDDGTFACGHADCGARLLKCRNYAIENVCNWCVADSTRDEVGADETDVLCRSCNLTRVIPDLSVEGNKLRWAELELAKRRMLYTLDLLELSYDDDAGRLPLSFEFKGDPIGTQSWRGMAGGGQIFTGHENGVITINIREADSVQREQTRVQMGEQLRTLIGHFRHEVGHYFWDRLIKGTCEEEFIRLFGDHNNPTYAEAKDAYYVNGAAADWRNRFITEYASMHPWEDFAETFAAYQDMMSMLDTAGNAGLIESIELSAPIPELVSRYQRLGIAINEINREMGLLDPAPFVFSAPVNQKLTYVHKLILDNK